MALSLCSVKQASAQMRLMHSTGDADDVVSCLSFFSPAKGYAGFGQRIGYTQDSGRTFSFKTISPEKIDYNLLEFGSVGFLIFNLRGVKAFAENDLLLYGDIGMVPSILRSTDGGNTFKLIFHSQYSLYPNSSINHMVFAPGSNTGYLVDRDRVWKTSNQGLNWSIVKIETDSDYDWLQAVNDQTVFALKAHATASKLVRTINGGANWETIPLPAQGVSAVSFLTGELGWANITEGNNAGSIYLTRDAGKNWELMNEPAQTPFSANQLFFLNDSTGYAMSRWLYKTTDAGKIWEKLVVENESWPSSLQFAEWDTQQMWAGGHHGTIHMTTNGGGIPVPAVYFSIDGSQVPDNGTVKLNNLSKPGHSYKWYRNGVLLSEAYHASYAVTNYEKPVDTIALVASNGFYADTLIKYYNVENPPLPVIKSFAPRSATEGDEITITGYYLDNITSVTLGNVPATTFTITSSEEIRVVVGAGASGSIKLKDKYNREITVGGFLYVDKANTITPQIQYVTPLQASMGATIRLTGKNFGNGVTKNIVYIGAVQATILTATSTEITCTLPAGVNFGIISLVNLDTKLIGKYDLPFSVVYPNISWVNQYSFKTGLTDKIGGIRNILSHDMDGDGKVDVIAAVEQNGAYTYKIYSNTSSADLVSLGTPVNIATIANGTDSFVLDDFNNDGKTDLLLCDGNAFLLYVNSSSPGNLSFVTPVRIVLSQFSNKLVLAAGDVDKDGKVDIVAGSDNSKTLQAVRNVSKDGAVLFEQPISVEIIAPVSSIALADVTGNGNPNIIFNAVNNGNAIFSWVENNSVPGTILFGKIETKEEAGGLDRGKICIADMDLNGYLDVVVFTPSKFLRFRNNQYQGSTVFTVEGSYNWPGNYNNAAVVTEFSGDKYPDILTSYNLTAFLRSAGGQFDEIDAGRSYNALSVADVDMDGRADIIAADNDSLKIYVSTINADKVTYMCEGTSDPVFSSLLGGSSYQWQIDEGNGFRNLTATDTAFSGVNSGGLHKNSYYKSDDSIRLRCIVDGAFSNTTTIRIRTYEPISVSIHTDVTQMCDGMEVTFTADVKGSISEQRLVWYINDGMQQWGWLDERGTSFTTNKIKEGYRVTAQYGGFHLCPYPRPENEPLPEGELYMDTSNVIEMHVGGLIPVVDISAPYDACEGVPVTFKANTNGTTTAASTFQWTLNGVNVGENIDSLMINQPAPGNLVRVSVTNPADVCGGPITTVSEPRSVAIKTATNPPVSITSSATDVCIGQPVMLIAQNKKYYNNAYTWFINGVQQPVIKDTLIIDSPVDGSIIKVVYTGKNECGIDLRGESTPITISVNANIIPTVSIEANSDKVCAGTSVVFTANVQDGGTNPSYVWLVNDLTTNATSNSFTVNTLKNNDKVRVKVIITGRCGVTEVMSNEIVMQVAEATTAPVIHIAGDTTIRFGESNMIVASVTNGNTANRLQWQENKNNGGWVNIQGAIQPQLLYQPLNKGDMVRCVLTANTDCISNDPVISNTLIFSTGYSRRVTQGHLYPNPVTHSFRVDSIDIAEHFIELKILSTAGLNQLYSKDIRGLTSVSVSVANLPKGEYLVVMIKQDGNRRVIRFTKL